MLYSARSYYNLLVLFWVGILFVKSELWNIASWKGLAKTYFLKQASDQCDQMVELKVAHFPKVAKM